MAKDEKAGASSGKDDDYQFIPEDFDEDAFIHREMVSFRTTTILFVWGVVAAGVSYLVFHAVDGAKVGWLYGLAIAAAFGIALKWLFPALKADIKHFARREWLGTGFLFFFTWLAFFLIVINPPVSDFAAPRVDLHAAPAVQQAGAGVDVYAFFEDNTRVASHEVTVTGPDGAVPFAETDLGRGQVRIETGALAAGVYVVEAEARDGRGHTTHANVTFAVVEAALTLDLPDGPTLDNPTDQVLVTVSGIEPCSKKLREQCIRTVYLRLDAAGLRRVTLEHDPKIGGWVAYPNYAGWTAGESNVTAVAEFMDVYAGSVRVDGGELVSGPRTVTVTAPLGEYQPKVVAQPGAPVRSVPGLELPLLALGLAALVAVLRRR